MTNQPSAALHASGLPDRWRHRDRFVILQSGFGGGHAFLAAWQAWSADPERCAQLHFIVIDRCLGVPIGANQHEAALSHRALQLAAAWPPITPNLHRLAFDDARVQLLLAPGEPAAWLREIAASVDAFLFCDDVGDDATQVSPLVSEPRIARAIARIAAPQASLVAARLDGGAIATLRAAGFRIAPAGGGSGTPGAAEKGRVVARYEPAFVPRAAARPRLRPASSDNRKPDKSVVIVGGGLAGCAAAWALAELGWRSTVLERHDSIAAEASGNPAGLFHGIVNGQDGSHARFNRAAAIEAHAAVQTAIARHGAGGATDGLLQLADAATSTPAMRSLLQRLHLPEAYVQALDSSEASAIAGIAMPRAAWFYPGGGWVRPGDLARSFIERAGSAVEVRAGLEVAELRRDGDDWQLLDQAGRLIEAAQTVVLANAGNALRLLGGVWPVEQVRGQISTLSIAPETAVQLPRIPIAGGGYVLPAVDGQLVFGATADASDDDPSVRHGDHARNLAQLAGLVPALAAVASLELARCGGRTSWRWTSRDRLPLIGAVPLPVDAAAAHGASPRLDQPRFSERLPGLFMFTALGSRGITWSALGAQVLASMITGAPSPIEASLLDAVDPARFRVREHRRSKPPGAEPGR